MESRYKVILLKKNINIDLKHAIAFLQEITQCQPDEAQFWLENLPHNLNSNATASQAEYWKTSLSNFGIEVNIQPPLSQPQNSTHEKEDWNLKASSKLKWSFHSITVSATLIGAIALVFILSIFFSYFYIQKNFFPNSDDVDLLLKQGSYTSAQNVTTKEIKAGRYSQATLLNRGKARILNLKAIGEKSGWSRHLTSRNWESGVDAVRNYYHSPIADSALKDLLLAHQLDPQNAETLKWLGILYQEREEFEKSLTAFQKALKIKPKDINLLNYLATAHISQGSYTKGNKILIQALQKDPDHPLSLKNLGSLNLYHVRDSVRALRYYLKYLKLKKNFDFDRPVIRQEVTQVLWNQHFPDFFNPKEPIEFHEFERKRKALEQAISDSPSPEAYSKMGDIFSKRNMAQEALLYWMKSLKENPKQPQVYNNIFKIQASLEKYSEVRGTLEKAIRENSALPHMYFALGLLYKYYEESPESAIKNFKNYLKTGESIYRKAAHLELEELQEK